MTRKQNYQQQVFIQIDIQMLTKVRSLTLPFTAVTHKCTALQ